MPPDRPTPKVSGCPICKAPAADAFRPFCSRRCADIDLNRWFTGRYAVAAVDLDERDVDELEALERGDGGDGGDDPGDGDDLL